VDGNIHLGTVRNFGIKKTKVKKHAFFSSYKLTIVGLTVRWGTTFFQVSGCVLQQGGSG